MLSKRLISAFTLATILLVAATAGAATLDPLLRGLLENASKATSGASILDYTRLLALEEDARTGRLQVEVILHLHSPAVPEAANGGPAAFAASTSVEGLRIGSIVGTIATARLPLTSLPDLAELSSVDHIEASRLFDYCMDMAVPDARVPQVWNGSPAYTGDGVIVGVIDSGIDWTHDDFRNVDGTTRIKAMWDLSGTGPPPSGYSYGTEYTATQISAALGGTGTVEEVDTVGHGTHVCGIAAGNGRASGGQYKGVAFDADIVFAKPEILSSARIIDSMNYLAAKAQLFSQPMAINMSLGGHDGAHDGSSAQEKVVDQLSGQGVVFFIAAGNEGADWIHDSVSASNSTLRYEIANYTPRGAGSDWASFGIWVDGSTSPTVQVLDLEAVPSGETRAWTGPLGHLSVDNASQGIDPNSGDKQIIIQIDDRDDDDPGSGIWTITIAGGSGTAHAWVYGSSMSSRFPDSDQSHSVAVPGTAQKAVTVAAYKTRNDWPAISGTVGYTGSLGEVPVGDHAPFSSIGPSRDGREKPDVIAPGMAIISCYSKDTTPPKGDNLLLPGNKYYATQGTSMATPLTCGVAALMLEKKGDLTSDEVKGVLRASARTDGFTGSTWNREFGEGKIDAQAALAQIEGPGPVADGDVDGDGEPTVLDVVQLVNYIVDPVGYPLSTAERQRADVFPPGGGDDQLNASDLARIVAFILHTDVPSAQASPTRPTMLSVGSPYSSEDGWWIPVTLRGGVVGAAQFALTLDGIRWRPDDVLLTNASRPHGDPTSADAQGMTVTARAVGDQIRILLYGFENRPAETGVTVHVPLESRPGEGSQWAPGAPAVTGILVAGPYGFALETKIEGDDRFLPSIRFIQAAPNPMRTNSTISYQLSRAVESQLAVYDARGRRVRLLHEGPQTPGVHTATWDGRDVFGQPVSAGVYFFRLLTPDQSEVRKVVRTR